MVSYFKFLNSSPDSVREMFDVVLVSWLNLFLWYSFLLVTQCCVSNASKCFKPRTTLNSELKKP